MPLIERIQTVRQRLREKTLVNEASVSIGVVLPLLDALGWPAFDPSVVAPEYNVGTRRVDFALLTHGRPAVFVEVKQPGLAGQADRQLFEYAFHEGVPIAVLTDGATWHVYLPAMQGSYDDRRVYLLDLLERDPADSAERLRRYLSRDAVESGEAFERAQADYRRSRQRKGAEAAIPQAWANLVTEPRLADLLASEVESVCGFQPEASDLTTFLNSLRPNANPLPPPRPKPTPPDPDADPTLPPYSGWTWRGFTLTEGTELRAVYKKQTFTALVNNGQIVIDGQPYESPSAAALAVTGRSGGVNGWIFWHARRPGETVWTLLSDLRKQPVSARRAS